jgi:hypothetical protein
MDAGLNFKEAEATKLHRPKASRTTSVKVDNMME